MFLPKSVHTLNARQECTAVITLTHAPQSLNQVVNASRQTLNEDLSVQPQHTATSVLNPSGLWDKQGRASGLA